MAENDQITAVQSFSERTLKYGRNLMAVSVPTIIFAWVPLVEIGKSKPFNFEIQEGGEIWIWRMLLAVLMYYGFRFFGLAFPDYFKWQKLPNSYNADNKAKLKGLLASEVKTNARIADHIRQRDEMQEGSPKIDNLQTNIDKHKTNLESILKQIPGTRAAIKDYRWRRTYFWIVDAGLPTALFIFAVGSAIYEISILTP